MKIDIYTVSTCSWCFRLKSWLNKYGYEYTNHDVTGNPEMIKDLISRTQQMGVPVTIVDDITIIVGYNPTKLAEILGK